MGRPVAADAQPPRICAASMRILLCAAPDVGE
jgi:hypothetical protein